MNTTTLILALLGYTSFVAGVVYFCVIADPQNSAVAKFLSVTLPRQVYNGLHRVFGDRVMQGIEWLGDKAMILVYCVAVFGSWLVIFVYVYPWIDRQSYLPKYHKIVGVFVFTACFTSWRYASRTSPGVITASNITRYDNFPFDNLMYVPNKKCPTRNIPKLARSKFDRYKYAENVPKFDHFCGWIDNTVGEENYRWFLLFLFVHVIMCMYGTWSVGTLFYGTILEKGLLEASFFNRQTGEEIGPNKYIIAQYLFAAHMAECSVLVLMGVMSIALALFLGYHFGLTCKNLTTNESYKWGDVKKWHKRESKRYQEALKKGEKVYRVVSVSPPVYDGDVTCTPAIPGMPRKQESTGLATAIPETSQSSNIAEVTADQLPDDCVIDPGPKPKNIYDRGIVENWKEVIFPLSLRKYKPKSKDT